jgi:hypothetical protein
MPGEQLRTERAKLAKELTEAQKNSESIPSWEESAKSLEANLKKAVKDGMELATKKK